MLDAELDPVPRLAVGKRCTQFFNDRGPSVKEELRHQSIGPSSNMRSSIGEVLSLRYCFVMASPKRTRSGAISVARLFEKSERSSSARAGAGDRAQRIRTGPSMAEKGQVQAASVASGYVTVW